VLADERLFLSEFDQNPLLFLIFYSNLTLNIISVKLK
jgi:hypothetical protein